MCEFTYSDNGKGLPDDFDINKSKFLGLTIVKSLSEQLDGEYRMYNDEGCNYFLRFPLRE